jgi:Flp pilus assembly pilin Flp
MRKLTKNFLRLKSDTRGVTSLEYSLLLGMSFLTVCAGTAYASMAAQTLFAQAFGFQ